MIIDPGLARSRCGLLTGDACCSYLMAGVAGLECAKGTAIEMTIIERRELGTMNAMGDRCSGPPDYEVSEDAG